MIDHCLLSTTTWFVSVANKRNSNDVQAFIESVWLWTEDSKKLSR